jgi:hypothetical protein
MEMRLIPPADVFIGDCQEKCVNDLLFTAKVACELQTEWLSG